MNVKLAVVIAFVELLYVIAQTYFPQFPISKELINTVVIAILALLGVDVVEFAAQAFQNGFRARRFFFWK